MGTEARTPEVKRQTVEEWLAAGNQVKVGKPQPFITLDRVLTIIHNAAVPDEPPARSCKFCGKPLDGRRRQIYCGKSCYGKRRSQTLFGVRRGPYLKAPPRVTGPLYDVHHRSYRVRLRFDGQHRDFSEKTEADARGIAESLEHEIAYFWDSGS